MDWFEPPTKLFIPSLYLISLQLYRYPYSSNPLFSLLFMNKSSFLILPAGSQFSFGIKDKKKERAAKGKEVAELKGEQSLDPCRLPPVGGRHPHGVRWHGSPMDPPVAAIPGGVFGLFFLGGKKADLVKKCPKTRAKQPLKIGPFYLKKGSFIILSLIF